MTEGASHEFEKSQHQGRECLWSGVSGVSKCGVRSEAPRKQLLELAGGRGPSQWWSLVKARASLSDITLVPREETAHPHDFQALANPTPPGAA